MLFFRDVVDLIGDHLDLFRRNQAVIGVDVMRTLSSEERDERLKYHLTASKELHPALISPESEYKVWLESSINTLIYLDFFLFVVRLKNLCRLSLSGSSAHNEWSANGSAKTARSSLPHCSDNC